jgi:hypothetical protein
MLLQPRRCLAAWALSGGVRGPRRPRRERACTLHAGMRDSCDSPPATPMSRAAISVPTALERLGAMRCMRSCTSFRMAALSASSASTMSAAAMTYNQGARFRERDRIG